MVQIDIDIPRPLLTLSIVSGFAAFMLWGGIPLPVQGVGGTGTTNAQVVRSAEEDMKRLREEQGVLERRESILRAELESLTREGERAPYDAALQAELQYTRQNLIALIQDQHEAEQEILTSLRQIWEAQGYAVQASRGQSNGQIRLSWPVEPELGISAYFADAGYQKRFGIAHHAIDLPVNQGSVVTAAANGTVVKVADNGMGFNSLVIRHANGFATMYGHVSEFLVEEGDTVRAGDPVALSGGRPGTPGAGRLTTGSDLHFELLQNGTQVDPLEFLPGL